MYRLENKFIEIGATKAIVKNTVTRVEFRKGKDTIEIVISLRGIICSYKETGKSHILPTKYINPILDVMNLYIKGETI